MRRTKRSKSKIIVGILSGIVLVLTIGYSFLSLNLRVLGLAHIGAVWNVHFDNITINPDSVSLSQGDIEPEIDEENDCKINYKVTLTPGDFYEFTFDIVNDGTIDGMIENIITRIEEDATATLPSYIDYSVSYSDDVVLETNQQLLAGTTETLKVKVEFKDEENVPQSETLDMSYESNYIKKTNEGTKVKHPQPLYDVFENEFNSHSGLVHKYTGNHHDSYTEEPSKNIYHWYSIGGTDVATILDKNNVIFANHCWQMWRTTDTGGVKLIYNGEAENNQCLNTRGTHVGYGSASSMYLNHNYWYGTDYTYDSSTQKFSLRGTLEQTVWNSTTGPGLVGKYTCASTDNSGTCSTLYLIESYYSSSSAYVFLINSSSNYSQFGSLEYNLKTNSLAYAGYMYGSVYESASMSSASSESFKTNATIFSYIHFEESFLYSKTINNTGSSYELVDPILGSDIPEDTYAEYYTFRSSTTIRGSSPYYIVGLYSGINYYYVQLSSTNDLSSYNLLLSGSITDNLDGTYSLSLPTSSITPIDWYTNYSNYNNKYTCGDATTTTCANPKYITSTYNYYYSYVNAGEKILIGKTRTGLNLTDIKTIQKDEWYSDYNTYSDYKYTCNTDSATCTEENLRMVSSFNTTGYSYYPNRYYGSSVTWDGTNYTLVDPIDLENYNNYTALSTHHYICVTPGLKTCPTVAYMYLYISSGYTYYITIRNGVLTVAQALENMLTKNTKNSTMKSGVDAWYKKYLYENYDQYIEDTIFCNNRSIKQIGGWNANGGNLLTTFTFKESSDGTNDLSCENTTDQFSISNPNARLSYKVGLMSSSEAKILNNSKIRKTGQYYWLATPDDFYNTYISGFRINTNGALVNDTYYFSGVRPAISLIPNIKYTEGDGSQAHPYIIKTN